MSQRYTCLDTIEDLLENFDRRYGNKTRSEQLQILNQALADIEVLTSQRPTPAGNTKGSLKHDLEMKIRFL